MTRRLVTRAIVPALLATLVAAPPAQAQFGGLIKRAVAGKAAEKAAEKVAPQESKPMASGEELTSTTLDQVIAGARAANGMLARNVENRRRLDTLTAQLHRMREQNQPTWGAYREANSKIESCRDISFNQSREKREAQVHAHTSTDPANMARMQATAMKYGQRIVQAQQRGDQAEVARLQMAMQSEIAGVDLVGAAHADTVAADAKCGKLPPKPAKLAAEEAQAAHIDALSDSIRTVEAQAVDVGAQASGMDKVRFLEQKERVLSILGSLDSRSGPVSYGKGEVELVRQHREELSQLRLAL